MTNHHTEFLPRRDWLQRSALASAGLLAASPSSLFAQLAGERPSQRAANCAPILPRNRVPMSFIIDDSTPLVNMAHFAIPQFAQVFPNNYKQEWRNLPREIPDSFVEKFASWCRDHGVKGKYSVTPYPACVGWVDREMPGWSAEELRRSLALIREDLTPDWDIHPEMVSHTWVIDTKTGRPLPEKSEYTMENWRWTDGKSVDQLADYLSYALQILKNVDLPCEGITTPGGFGNRVLPELAQATLQSCRDVFQAEIPHYFRHLYTDDRSVAPRVEYASGLQTADPQCVVSIIGCTGDWFGGWDGLTPGSVDRFITEDLQGGRLPEVIDRGEPAILVCHWPGIYYNGAELGFNIFKEAVSRVHQRYDNLLWMKLSEIARYWAAKELTAISVQGNQIHFNAPYATKDFTVRLEQSVNQAPIHRFKDQSLRLERKNSSLSLQSGTFTMEDNQTLLCFDLPKGQSHIEI